MRRRPGKKFSRERKKTGGKQGQRPKRDGHGRWKRGASGNPKGRPRLGETARDYLEQALSREEWARRVVALCRKGSIRALELYAERVFGRAASEAGEQILRKLAELEAVRGAERNKAAAPAAAGGIRPREALPDRIDSWGGTRQQTRSGIKDGSKRSTRASRLTSPSRRSPS